MTKQLYLFLRIFCLILFSQIDSFSQNSHNDYYNPSNEVLISFEKGDQVVEPGNFKIFVGGSSPGVRSKELGKIIKEVSFIVK